MNPELKTEIDQTLPLLHGWCQLEKALHLASLIVDNQIQTVVEIGVFGGQSLIPMAMALRHSGSKGFALGIDPMSIAAAIEGDVGKENADWWSNKVNLEEVYAGFVRSVLDLKLTYHCRWIRAHSEEAIRMILNESIELLHLDSNHSESVSCRDAEGWWGKVALNGLLVMDDSNWPSQAKAMEELRGFGPLIGEYPNGAGNQYAVFQKRK